MAWRFRAHLLVRLTAAGTLALSALWAFELLGRTPDWLPWLRGVIVLAGFAAAAALVVGTHLRRQAGIVAASVALAALLGGPTAYTLATVSTAHSGSLPTAGPNATAGPGGGGTGGGGAGGLAGGPPAGPPVRPAPRPAAHPRARPAPAPRPTGPARRVRRPARRAGARPAASAAS